MNDHRQRATDGLCLLLNETRDKLLSGNRGCGYGCSSITYRSSYKANAVERSAFAKPAAPLTYKSLAQRMSSFRLSRWYGSSSVIPDIRTVALTHPSRVLFGALKDIIDGLDLDSLIHD